MTERYMSADEGFAAYVRGGSAIFVAPADRYGHMCDLEFSVLRREGDTLVYRIQYSPGKYRYWDIPKAMQEA